MNHAKLTKAEKNRRKNYKNSKNFVPNFEKALNLFYIPKAK